MTACLAALVIAVPLPDGARVPNLAFVSSEGTIAQTGRLIAIAGELWTATGEIRADGKIEIHWTTACGWYEAVGLYEYRSDGPRLVGQWGLVSHGARIDEAGNLTGHVASHRVYRFQ